MIVNRGWFGPKISGCAYAEAIWVLVYLVVSLKEATWVPEYLWWQKGWLGRSISGCAYREMPAHVIMTPSVQPCHNYIGCNCDYNLGMLGCNLSIPTCLPREMKPVCGTATEYYWWQEITCTVHWTVMLHTQVLDACTVSIFSEDAASRVLQNVSAYLLNCAKSCLSTIYWYLASRKCEGAVDLGEMRSRPWWYSSLSCVQEILYR